MRILLALLLALCIVLACAYYGLAERLLRDLRRRYPAQWESAGRPTFLSSALWGRGYWRPVSADNFFRYRRYSELSDEAMIQRAERVRRWQSLLYVAVTAWALVALWAMIVSR